MSQIKWHRGEKLQLSPNLTGYELECKDCTCDVQITTPEFVNAFQAVRNKMGKAVTITSGYRCAAKQARLRAAGYETAEGVSSHELGLAADMRADDMIKLRKYIHEVFNSIGVASSFVHGDMRPLKPGGIKRIWGYSNV